MSAAALEWTLMKPEEINPDEFRQGLEELEALCGAPRGSLAGLASESDWALFIKAHALIESAVSHAVVSSTDARFKDILAKLPLGREDSGKLAFAKALGLVTTEHVAFIKLISRIRNTLAHNAAYLAFELRPYIDAMQEPERERFFRELTFDIVAKFRQHWIDDVFRPAPHIGIIRGTIAIVTRLVSAGERAKLNRSREELAKAFLQEAERLGDESSAS
jgi:hypothetical protein